MFIRIVYYVFIYMLTDAHCSWFIHIITVWVAFVHVIGTVGCVLIVNILFQLIALQYVLRYSRFCICSPTGLRWDLLC